MKRLRSMFNTGKFWKISILLLFVFSIAAGFYFFTIYNDAKGTVNEVMHEQIPSIERSVTQKKLKAQEPLTILLLGVDERQNDRGRSDALMVMTLDPENKRSQLISIPRDTRTELVGDDPKNGSIDKINHAYAFGGPDMTVSTVENFLDIEVDYYVKVNMEGLADLVDTVGGITVDNPIDWVGENGFHYKQGELTLNGEEALQFVRMRYDDPQGDLGRNERQRQVIQGILDQGASISSVNKIGEMLDVLGSSVTTNIEFNTIQNLLFHYRSARETMSTYQLKGTGTEINGIYYLQVSDDEVQQVHTMINEPDAF
ncbi:LCP family glycopolymer transferase [Salimicrobium halophilum]|uniref:Cell envelope-related function transcriptional attenuator common domain-containing protein n=1 Tax=Salimicrobium halophilum TaxID=86666 RepID=A0A1G8SC37_9BACI|nr:LCP family protein [Salimicrobium halophilum]SDJ26764.1 cell envelope-related function transcriptional attenuator common domain-containing protein [Salimicrobium halophilum]